MTLGSEENVIQWVHSTQVQAFHRWTNTKKYLFRNGRQSTQSVTYDSNLSKYNIV